LTPATRFAELNVVLDAEKSRMVEAAAAWLNDRLPTIIQIPTPPLFAWAGPPKPGLLAVAAADRRADLGDAGRRLPARGVSLAPRFDQPLVNWLDPHFLLGAVTPEPETVCGLAVNATFIEAVMIGANHELARELRWRGIPLDLSATFFKRFFDGQVALSDMAEWHSTPLGDHYPVAQSTVVFFRSKLVEHLGELTVFLARAKRIPDAGHNRGGRVVDEAVPALEPFFRGNPAPGMAYFGFDLPADALKGSANDAGWYLVLEERAGGTKFGFDEEPVQTIKTWDDVAWPDVAAPKTLWPAVVSASAAASSAVVLPEPATPTTTLTARPELQIERTAARCPSVNGRPSAVSLALTALSTMLSGMTGPSRSRRHSIVCAMACSVARTVAVA